MGRQRGLKATKPAPPASLSDLANRLESARVHIILYSFKEEGKPIDTKASIVNEQLDPIIRALESQKDIREQDEAEVRMKVVEEVKVYMAEHYGHEKTDWGKWNPKNENNWPMMEEVFFLILKGRVKLWTEMTTADSALISRLTPPTGATDA
jgi:hypothetical protein